MEQTFKSVDRMHLQKAFAMAHRAAESLEFHSRERKIFRAIAREIWEACGESGGVPASLPSEMKDYGILSIQQEVES